MQSLTQPQRHPQSSIKPMGPIPFRSPQHSGPIRTCSASSVCQVRRQVQPGKDARCQELAGVVQGERGALGLDRLPLPSRFLAALAVRTTVAVLVPTPGLVHSAVLPRAPRPDSSTSLSRGLLHSRGLVWRSLWLFIKKSYPDSRR